MIESDRDRNVRNASAEYDLVVMCDDLRNRYSLSAMELYALLTAYLADNMRKLARRRRRRINNDNQSERRDNQQGDSESCDP